MFKIIITMKRKPGITREEFIEYYNNNHLPYTARVLTEGTPRPTLHRRNFVTTDDPFLAVVGENRAVNDDPPVDAFTEIYFESRSEAMAMFSDFFDPVRFDGIREDEANFVDLESIRFFAVEVAEYDRVSERERVAGSVTQFE
jgi:EthD protein.